MLDKILQTLDESVFTEEIKESLHESFEDAVNAKAHLLVEEKIEELEFKSKEHIEVLDEKSIQHIEMLESKSQEHIEFLEEKAEEYVQLKEQEILDRLDEYLERVVEEFVSEAKGSLQESIEAGEGVLVREAFESMLLVQGAEMQKSILESSDESIRDEIETLKSQYNEAVNETFELKRKNQELMKLGLVTEMCEGLTALQVERFKRLVEGIEFTNDEKYVQRLESIKESIFETENVQTEVTELEEVLEESLVESTEEKDFGNLFSFSHLV